MDRPRLLLALTILLAVLSNVVPSNPDSEIVQDTSEGSKDHDTKQAQFRIFNDRKGERGPYLPGVRLMRPFVMGSRIVWREVGLPRPFFSQMGNNRTILSAPDDNKESTGIGKLSDAGKSPLGLENDVASKIPEASKPEETTALSFPDSESEENLEPSVGGGNKKVSDENTENVPSGTQNPSGLKPNAKTPASAPGNEVSPNSQNPQPEPIAPTQNIPENGGSTHRISPDSNLFAGMINNFTFKLMETLNLETNFVVSPLSIFIALAMCYLGSDGNTKSQIEQALGMNDNAVHEEHLHQGIKDLMSVIAPQSSDYSLFVANGMFLGKNFTPEATFMEDIEKYYAAEIKNLDFKDRASLKAINDWVSGKTRSMIPKLLKNPPDPLTRLILLNAVYFKGTWKLQFPKEWTQSSRFRSLDGREQMVPTMYLQRKEFPFYRSDERRHTFIKLPYEGDEVSMVIALPYSVSEKPMDSMTDQDLCHILDAMENTEIDMLAIPKFRLEYTRSLKRPLIDLGITDLFTPMSADLSRLRKWNDLYVSAVLHKAKLEVTEEGTTAAAATAVMMVTKSRPINPRFMADHPFAFYVVHEPSGLVLFHGKVFNFDGGIGGGRNEKFRVRPRPNSRGTQGPRVRYENTK